MYELKKVEKCNVAQLHQAALILNACGRDMAEKYGLHHWDNPFIKTLLIVALCSLKNDVFLLHDNERPVATFMTRKNGDLLHFEKLGTHPDESGKGIGTLCMKEIEDLAKNAGCRKVGLEVYEPSRHAIMFYEHRGYKAVGMTDTLKYKEVKMEKSVC